jgi:hypothetical protein
MFELNKHFKIIALLLVTILVLYLFIVRVIQYKLAEIENKIAIINGEQQLIELDYKIKQHREKQKEIPIGEQTTQ